MMQGIGGVIRDADGNLIGGYWKFINHQTNTFAEIAAVLHDLKLCSEIRLNKIWIETDPQIAVELNHKEYVGHWSLQHNWIHIIKFYRRLNSRLVTFTEKATQFYICWLTL